MDKLTEYRIKQAANVVDVLTDHGIELFRKGRELVGMPYLSASTFSASP